MGICALCGESDTKHEVSTPSERFEIKNGKEIKVCDGFVDRDFARKVTILKTI